MIHYKQIPIFAGILGGLAFVSYSYKAPGMHMLIVLIIFATLGALVSIGLRYLMIKFYHNSNNKISIKKYISISLLPFVLFFLMIIISNVSNYILALNYITYGLTGAFGLSTLLLLSLLAYNRIRKTTLVKAVSLFVGLTLIALSLPVSLHLYISNSLPCANGQCKIETHKHN